MPQSPQGFDPSKPFTIFDPNKAFKVVEEQPATAPEKPKGVSGGYGTLATIGDLVIGAGKGAANTAIGLGQMVHRIPGVSTLTDAVYGLPSGASQASFPAAREAVQPTNTAQQVGYTGEQIGEFFLPGPKGVGMIGRGVQAGAHTLAQTDSLPTAMVGGALGMIPTTLTAAAGKLKAGAEKTVAQALGATKEANKATAAKLAPGMLQRGVRGSREAMLAEAEKNLAQVGPAIGSAIDTAAAAGATLPSAPMRQAFRTAAEGLMVPNAAGELVPIEGVQPILTRLAKLDTFVASLGDDIPVDRAQKIKGIWDRIVDKAGLYGQKAGASASDAASAWVFREGASGLRKAFNSDSPTFQALTQEYAFWKGLRNVLKATELRTQAQSGGLQAAIGMGSGAVAGASTGDSLSDSIFKASVGAAMGRKMVTLMQSPYWRTTVSAPLKNRLADALASDSGVATHAAVRSILASLPAQVSNALKEPQ